MMKLLFSTLGRGTEGLLKNWCYSFLLLMIMLNSHTVTAKEFECYFDRCNTDDGQYCDESEGEKRCNHCPCEPGPVIPQCQEICAKKMVTTTEIVPTTEEIVTTTEKTVTTTVLPALTENSHLISIIILISILLAFVITGVIIVGYLFATKKYCFAEPQTPSSSAMSSEDSLLKIDSFEMEMDDSPIFKTKKLPIEEQGNKRSDDCKQIHTTPTLDGDSERHQFMMGDPQDIAILENKSQLDEETSPKHTLF